MCLIFKMYLEFLYTFFFVLKERRNYIVADCHTLHIWKIYDINSIAIAITHIKKKRERMAKLLYSILSRRIKVKSALSQKINYSWEFYFMRKFFFLWGFLGDKFYAYAQTRIPIIICFDFDFIEPDVCRQTM